MPLETLLQDFRYARRSLARSPALSLAAVLTLGLGIGANTAMFGVVDQLFFRPPAHVVKPGRVVRLYVTTTTPPFGTSTSGLGTFARYQDFHDHARSFSAVAAFGRPDKFSLGVGESAQRVTGEMVTASFFPLLGVRPVLGRFFSPEEDRAGRGDRVAVLSSEFWKRHFDAQRTVLGTTLHLGRSVYTVIGVAPAGFAGIGFEVPDVWLPMSVTAPETMGPAALSPNFWWLDVVARLRDGVNPAQADAEGTALYRSRFVQVGDSTGVVSHGPVHEALGPNVDSNAKLALWLAVVCGIVLLIGCANVTNLLLARSVQRRREIAVRVALGASRGRLARQLLVEGGWLTVLGGAAAILVTLWLGPVLRASFLPEATVLAPLDLRLLAFTASAVVVTTLVAGSVPALQASAPDLTAALKTGAREGSRHHSATRTVLLVGQVALTLVLLTGAGLFITSLQRVRHQRLGFDAEQLISASVDLSSLGYAPADINTTYQRMRERLRRLPGVTGASLSIGNPFGWSFVVSLEVPGLDTLPQSGSPYVSAVTDDYFRTLGTRVLRGRGFTGEDTKGGQHVAVIAQTMARLYWPTEDAIGKCLKIGGRNPPCTMVVGVVEDSPRNSITEGATPQYYVPLAQADSVLRAPVSALLIRTAGPAAKWTAEVRREIQAAVPNLPYPDIDPMPSLFARQLRPWRLGSALLSLLGGLGLLLAAIGLYGVLSYIVSQRTQELGIRIALGAGRRDLLRMVVRQGLRVTFIGVAAGAAGALLAGKAIASLLYEVSPHDPLVLISVTLFLVVVALVASYLPARRATRVDPMVALRYE
jgi:predicted permease